MDLIQAISSGTFGKTQVEIPELATDTDPGIFEVRELSIEARMRVRAVSWVDTDEKDDKGEPKRRYDDGRNSMAIIVEATFRPDGRKVFTAPDAIDMLLALPGHYEAPLAKLLAPALELFYASPKAEETARKNSPKTRTSATS